MIVKRKDKQMINKSFTKINLVGKNETKEVLIDNNATQKDPMKYFRMIEIREKRRANGLEI
jgi:ribulose bisphosphate carboxylase small subunit